MVDFRGKQRPNVKGTYHTANWYYSLLETRITFQQRKYWRVQFLKNLLMWKMLLLCLIRRQAFSSEYQNLGFLYPKPKKKKKRILQKLWIDLEIQQLLFPTWQFFNTNGIIQLFSGITIHGSESLVKPLKWNKLVDIQLRFLVFFLFSPCLSIGLNLEGIPLSLIFLCPKQWNLLEVVGPHR